MSPTQRRHSPNTGTRLIPRRRNEVGGSAPCGGSSKKPGGGPCAAARAAFGACTAVDGRSGAAGGGRGACAAGAPARARLAAEAACCACCSSLRRLAALAAAAALCCPPAALRMATLRRALSIAAHSHQRGARAPQGWSAARSHAQSAQTEMPASHQSSILTCNLGLVAASWCEFGRMAADRHLWPLEYAITLPMTCTNDPSHLAWERASAKMRPAVTGAWRAGRHSVGRH